jgi:hypothetical protein
MVCYVNIKTAQKNISHFQPNQYVFKGLLPNLNYITLYAFVNRVGGNFQIKIQLTNKNGTSSLQKIL